MSRSDKDKAGGHIRRQRGILACGCCTTLSPKVNSPQRATRERASLRYETLVEAPEGPQERSEGAGHVILDRRCIYCAHEALDIDLYPHQTQCLPDRAPLLYSTATGEPPLANHPALTTP